MCMLYVAWKNAPPEGHMTQAAELNDDGIGVAWRETKAGQPVVKWKKGMEIKEALPFIKKLKFPYIIHMRKASQGGKSPLLNHPFPVSETVPLALDGEIKGSVLAHNGTWGSWRSFMQDVIKYQGKRIPKGPWSDSRAYAWILANYGEGALEMAIQESDRVVVFGPKGSPTIYNWDRWESMDGWMASQKLTVRDITPRGVTHIWDGDGYLGRRGRETSDKFCGRIGEISQATRLALAERVAKRDEEEEEVEKADVSTDPDVGVNAPSVIVADDTKTIDVVKHYTLWNIQAILGEIMRMGIDTMVQELPEEEEICLA